MSNTYERYAELVGSTTPLFVTDLDGKQYDMTTKVVFKLKAAKRNYMYWDKQRASNPDDKKAERFCEKFSHLHEQMKLFLMRSNEI